MATPEPWRGYVASMTSQTAPEPMAEGAGVTVAGDESGHDPADRAIMAAWKAVLPRHGLLP